MRAVASGLWNDHLARAVAGCLAEAVRMIRSANVGGTPGRRRVHSGCQLRLLLIGFLASLSPFYNIAKIAKSLKVKYQDIEVGVDLDPEALLEAVGTAAQKATTALIIFIDEMQYVTCPCRRPACRLDSCS
jgi:hypothetical protein